MPSPVSKPTKPTKRRVRGRRGLRAVAAVVASSVVVLVSHSPVHAHAEAKGNGLRGGYTHPPQHALDDLGDYDNELRRLGSNDETAMQDENAEVRITPFTTNLLEVHFPLNELKNNENNRLLDVTSSHIAQSLSETLDESLVNLGIDITKRQQRIGSEIRYVLDIEGVATFDEPPKEDVVNAAVHAAFAGDAKKIFLEKVYSRYEVGREKREWDYESGQRLSRGRRQKKKPRGKKKKDRNKGKKKKKMKNPKKSQGGGGEGGKGEESSVNAMGYDSGLEGMSAMNGGGNKDEGYEIINGNIHVDVDKKGSGGGGGGGKNGSKNKPSNKPGKMQMQQGQVSKPEQSSEGGINLMGYVSGSQGSNAKDNDEENDGYEIKNGDIYVTVRGNNGN